MNSTIFMILIVVMVFMTIQNFKKVKQNNTDSQYVESYRKIINRDEEALSFTKEYMEKETNEALTSKTRIMLIGELLEKGLDTEEELNKIDFKAVFCNSNGFSMELFNQHSDCLLWVMSVMAKANRLNRRDVIETLHTKFMEVSGMEKTVEYKMVESYYNVFTGNKDFSFINLLLAGDYADYPYNRQLIGLMKRFAESLKAYSSEELDELSLADLPSFADTSLGDYLMKDLGIYEQYAKKKEEDSYLDSLNKESNEEKEETTQNKEE